MVHKHRELSVSHIDKMRIDGSFIWGHLSLLLMRRVREQLTEMTYALRIGGQPFFKDKTHLIHAAISYQHEEFNGDTFSNIDNSLLSHVGDGDALVANFETNADDSNAYDIEANTVYGVLFMVYLSMLRGMCPTPMVMLT